MLKAAIALVVLSACGKQSASHSSPSTDHDGSRSGHVAPAPSCRAAVISEVQLLASSARADSPELGEKLEDFAARPVVTRDSVSGLVELRRIVGNVAHGANTKSLEQAAEATVAACKLIDTPEQRAVEAVDRMIVLLEKKDYRGMLQQFATPQEREEWKKTPRFEEIVSRFEGGWGETLLEKLRAARTHVPDVNDDGSVTFTVPGAQGPLTHPITMVEIAGSWYVGD
jgi:hypothetical protein